MLSGKMTLDPADSSPSRIAAARRVVIKIGSALLVDRASNRLDAPWFESLVEDVARLRRRGQEVLVVSSGAIALGRRHLGLRAGALRLEESQAAAAAGQVQLAHAWQEALGRQRDPRSPGAADAGRHGATPALPQCPRHPRDPARARRGAGHQRERHGGHGGDPLRRQRSPGGPGGADDQRGLPGAAVGHVRAATRPIRRAIPRPGWCPRSTR